MTSMPCSASGAKLLALSPQCEEPSKSTCLQGIRKEAKSSVYRQGQSFSGPHGSGGTCVYIYCTIRGSENIGLLFLLWAPIFYSTQLQLRSTRTSLILLIKLTVQMNALYIARSLLTLCSTSLPCQQLLCVMSAWQSEDLNSEWAFTNKM